MAKALIIFGHPSVISSGFSLVAAIAWVMLYFSTQEIPLFQPPEDTKEMLLMTVWFIAWTWIDLTVVTPR